MLALLLCADDAAADRLTALLAEEDISLVRGRDGRAGLELARQRAQSRGYAHFDLVLLAARLPDMPAEAALAGIRSVFPLVPAVLLDGPDAALPPASPSPRTPAQPDSPRVAIQAGDGEIVAALYRALGRPLPQPWVVQAPPYELVFKADRLSLDGRRVHLSAKEVQLLEHLARRRGEVVSKAALSKHLFPEHDELDPKILDVYVTHARRILSSHTAGRCMFIATVWGRGYTFAGPAPE